MYFTRIDKKLDIIIDYMKSNPNSSNSRSSEMLDQTFLNNFPMNDLECLKKLHESLKTNDIIIKLVKKLKN